MSSTDNLEELAQEIADYASVMCILSGKILREPVKCSDGWTYEKTAIEEYHKKKVCHGKILSPATGELIDLAMTPDDEMKIAVKEYLEKNPDFQDEFDTAPKCMALKCNGRRSSSDEDVCE
jgi:hypothetical protein